MTVEDREYSDVMSPAVISTELWVFSPCVNGLGEWKAGGSSQAEVQLPCQGKLRPEEGAQKEAGSSGLYWWNSPSLCDLA